MREQQVLVGLRGLHPLARGGKPLLGGAPLGPRACNRARIGTRVAVEEQAVAARVGKPAIVMLAVELDQRRGDIAQQRDPDRLVVDEGLAAPVGLERAPDDQRLAGLEFDIGFVERGVHRWREQGEFEGGGHARLVFSGTHQPAVGAVAEHQPERVEQDRLARPGFAGEHAEPAAKIEVECLDQHDIADGQAGEHRQWLSAASRARHACGAALPTASARTRNSSAASGAERRKPW